MRKAVLAATTTMLAALWLACLGAQTAPSKLSPIEELGKKRSGVQLAGAEAVVVGRSNIVGKPVALMLIQESATVTVCHSKTKDLGEVSRRADVLVVAIGRPKFITADMVKPGAVVIDVGVNRLPDGKLCGDVDYGPLSEKVAQITPVPGGVGPMTIAMLMFNTVNSARRRAGLPALK